MKFLIAALGNPGTEYALTRHNIGFMVADTLASREGFEFTLGRHAYVADWKFKGKHLHIIKPTTYMNLSGKAVQYWLTQLKLEKEQLLVISDDIALPFGKLRIKPKGSSGGQNGLNHINELLGTENYPRMRCGIGNNFSPGRQTDYVLGNFSIEEQAKLPEILGRSADAVVGFCTEGIERTMNKFN